MTTLCMFEFVGVVKQGVDNIDYIARCKGFTLNHELNNLINHYAIVRLVTEEDCVINTYILTKV